MASRSCRTESKNPGSSGKILQRKWDLNLESREKDSPSQPCGPGWEFCVEAATQSKKTPQEGEAGAGERQTRAGRGGVGADPQSQRGPAPALGKASRLLQPRARLSFLDNPFSFIQSLKGSNEIVDVNVI